MSKIEIIVKLMVEIMFVIPYLDFENLAWISQRGSRMFQPQNLINLTSIDFNSPKLCYSRKI